MARPFDADRGNARGDRGEVGRGRYIRRRLLLPFFLPAVVPPALLRAALGEPPALAGRVVIREPDTGPEPLPVGEGGKMRDTVTATSASLLLSRTVTS